MNIGALAAALGTSPAVIPAVNAVLMEFAHNYGAAAPEPCPTPSLPNISLLIWIVEDDPDHHFEDDRYHPAASMRDEVESRLSELEPEAVDQHVEAAAAELETSDEAVLMKALITINYRSCKMRCFYDSRMDQGFFQVSSFPLTRKSPRHMLQKRGPCLARHTSTSAGGSPAADSPPTRRRPAPASGPEAMPPRRSPRLVEDLHCNRPASQGNSSPAKSSARVKA